MRKLLYGSISLLSEDCPNCGRESFVVEGRLVCCGRRTLGEPMTWKRMSATKKDRRFWSAAFREALIHEQNSRCFWCELRFDKDEWRDGRLWKKSIHIEHVEPFIYAQNEARENIVASCSICNLIKSCLMFKTIDECREYIQHQRILKDYTTSKPEIELSDLRDTV